MESIIKLTKEFEDKNITTITYRGRPAWIAAEIGRVLGYSKDGTRLTGKIRDDWNNELVEGKDFLVLRGKELRDFKELMALTPELGISPNTPFLMILFESGLHYTCIKTAKPIGKRLRRLLVDEVMPQLVRDGAYLPERTVTDNGRISDKQATILLRRKREERLARQQALKERQFAFKEQMFRHKAFENHIAQLRRSGQLGEAVIVNIETEMMEDLLDMDLSSLKIAETPVAEEATLSPTEIARQLRSNAYTVGRIISKLGIRGDARYSREIPNKARYCNREIRSFLYKPCVVGMVRDELNRQTNQQLSLLSGAVKYGLGSLNRSE